MALLAYQDILVVLVRRRHCLGDQILVVDRHAKQSVPDLDAFELVDHEARILLLFHADGRHLVEVIDARIDPHWVVPLLEIPHDNPRDPSRIRSGVGQDDEKTHRVALKRRIQEMDGVVVLLDGESLRFRQCGGLRICRKSSCVSGEQGFSAFLSSASQYEDAKPVRILGIVSFEERDCRETSIHSLRLLYVAHRSIVDPSLRSIVDPTLCSIVDPLAFDR